MYINYTGLIKKFVSLLVKTKHYKWHLTSFKKFIFVTVVITARNFFFFLSNFVKILALVIEENKQYFQHMLFSWQFPDIKKGSCVEDYEYLCPDGT